MSSLRCVVQMAVLSVTLLLSPAHAAEIIRLTSLEWPPYTSEHLPQGGASSAVVSAAFAAMGYQVQIEFLPWERAVALARAPDSGYAGYFPEYYSRAITEHFYYSTIIGRSPLGLAERRQAPVVWRELADLNQYVIGIVDGYVNTDAFDARVAAGLQPVERVSTDQQNLRKLVAQRLPAVVIDRYVMQYLIGHDPQLSRAADQLQFHPRLLENKTLHVCFRKGPEGERYAQILADGLNKIDSEAIIRAYFSALQPP